MDLPRSTRAKWQPVNIAFHGDAALGDTNEFAHLVERKCSQGALRLSRAFPRAHSHQMKMKEIRAFGKEEAVLVKAL